MNRKWKIAKKDTLKFKDGTKCPASIWLVSIVDSFKNNYGLFGAVCRAYCEDGPEGVGNRILEEKGIQIDVPIIHILQKKGVCQKLKFKSKKSAKDAGKRINSTLKGTLRNRITNQYFCDDCQSWHNSSMTKKAINKLRKYGKN